MENSKDNLKKITLKKITLKELQNTFPIHVKDKTDQTFTFRDWGMDEEEEISKIKSKNPTMGKFISSILCFMLKTINGEDFEGLESKKRKLIINQMFSGNVIYMYMYLRYDQVDDRLAFQFDCPFCGKRLDQIVVSLDDLDVDCKHDDYQDFDTYKLMKPITLDKGQQIVEILKIGITKWDIIENAGEGDGNREFEGMRTALINGIVGVEGIESVLNIDEIVKKLRKVDMEYIHKKISDHNGGPDIQLPVECKSCNSKSYHQIEWGYESFFGVSSLPPQSKS